MISELARELDAVAREKGIPRDALLEVLEQAMVAAARKKYGLARDFEAQWNEEMGEVELFEFKTVADTVEDPDLEIDLDSARRLDPECEVGDSLGIKMPVADLGRIAAQTAKQVIIQKIRDAEREMTFAEFKDRKGEIITGIVRRFEKGNIIVDLGRAEAVLPKREQVPTETYRQGDRIQAYVVDITRAMGKRVSLHYEEKVGLPTRCFGETRHFVTHVTINPDIPLGPGVSLPTAPPAASAPAPSP